MRRIAALCLLALCMMIPATVIGQTRQNRDRSTSQGGQRNRDQSQDRSQLSDRSREYETTRTRDILSRLSDVQQQNVEQLNADLTSLKAESQVTQEQKTALQNDLVALADGATKPDPVLVAQLMTDLSNVFADQSLGPAEMLQLSADLQQVLNSANIPLAEVTQAIEDIEAILLASGVSQADVQTIVRDLQAIAAETQKNAQGASDKAQGLKGTIKGKRK